MSKAQKSQRLNFFKTPAHDCPYLAEKQSKTIFLSPEIQSDPLIYSALIEHGFRRSGTHIYRPNCDSCNACISVRVPVARFTPNKNQRRSLKKSGQFQQHTQNAIYTQTHYDLFDKYLRERHSDGDMYPTSKEQFESFLLADWLDCRFLNFVDIKSQQLVACCVYDKVDNGLSAVYTFFDPDYAKFGLGKLAILELITLAKTNDLPYVYLGYWIKESQKMAYKGDYRPLECFIEDRWILIN